MVYTNQHICPLVTGRKKTPLHPNNYVYSGLQGKKYKSAVWPSFNSVRLLDRNRGSKIWMCWICVYHDCFSSFLLLPVPLLPKTPCIWYLIKISRCLPPQQQYPLEKLFCYYYSRELAKYCSQYSISVRYYLL
jgi:hypothetical protein